MSKDFEDLTEVYNAFPFLEAFPFKLYKISIGKDKAFGIDLESAQKLLFQDYDLKIQPIPLIHFTYINESNDITISFYFEDIAFLAERSEEIIKLDSVRKIIDRGLKNVKFSSKMKAIKELDPFMKKAGTSDILKKDTFYSVLRSIQEIHEIALTKDVVDKLRNLDVSLKSKDLLSSEQICVNTYLNFQLHHAKIILGTIIAAKIY